MLMILNLLFGDTGLKPGDEAPNFTLMDQDSVLHTLSDYRGKQVVLYFFPKAETPGWIKQACGFRDAFADFKDKGIKVFGVSYDSPKALKDFEENHHIPFIFLSDEKKIAGKAYGVNRYFFTSRKTFLIEKDGRILKIYDKVDLNSHPDDILNYFDEHKQKGLKWKYLSNIAVCEITYHVLPVWKRILKRNSPSAK